MKYKLTEAQLKKLLNSVITEQPKTPVVAPQAMETNQSSTASATPDISAPASPTNTPTMVDEPVPTDASIGSEAPPATGGEEAPAGDEGGDMSMPSDSGGGVGAGDDPWSDMGAGAESNSKMNPPWSTGIQHGHANPLQSNEPWSSGIQRGVANQIDPNTKWADMIGTTRGKANPLKEDIFKQALKLAIRKILSEQDKMTSVDRDLMNQESVNNEKKEAEKKQKEQNFADKYISVEIPPNSEYKGNTIVLPKGTSFKVWEHPINPFKFSPDYKNWKGTSWEAYIPTEEELERIFPEGTLRYFTTPNNKFYKATIKRISDPPHLKHAFGWYVDSNNIPYEQPFEKDELPEGMTYKDQTFWEKWGDVILQVAATLLATWITGGMSIWVQLAVHAGIDLTFAGKQLIEGDNFGAALSAIIAFVPLSSTLLGIGNISGRMLKNITSKVASCSGIRELKAVYKGFTEEEKIAFTKIFSNQSDKLVKATSKAFYDKLALAVKNGNLSLSKIPLTQRKHLREFLFQLVTSIGITGAAVKIRVDQMMRQMEGEVTKEIHSAGVDLGSDEDFAAFEAEYKKSHPTN
jgi:hypothetical protein